jgi:hypothetical protein
VSQRYQPNSRMTTLGNIKAGALPTASEVVTRVFEEACRYIPGHSQPLPNARRSPDAHRPGGSLAGNPRRPQGLPGGDRIGRRPVAQVEVKLAAGGSGSSCLGSRELGCRQGPSSSFRGDPHGDPSWIALPGASHRMAFCQDVWA